ncbi:MAG: hypothetical protein ACRC3B_16810 [Bacteroidia bacterium]
MRYKLSLFLLAALLLFSGARNTETKVLTRQQMYADFDQLVSTLKQVSPHLICKKTAWGYDVEPLFTQFRTEIDTISSQKSFHELISKTITTCQDGHTVLLSRYPYPQGYWGKLFIPLRYLNGEYVVTRNFSYENVSVPAGSIVSKAMNKPVHDYVQTLTPYRYFMHYDMNNKRFYYNHFYQNDKNNSSAEITLEFITPDNKPIALQLKASQEVNIEKITADLSDTKKIEYWAAERTLYIRIPAMNYDDVKYYRSQIPVVGKDKPIDRVLIDIRSNLGGSDLVWRTVYEQLIDKPAEYKNVLMGYNPSYMPGKYRKQKKLAGEIAVEKTDWLGGGEFCKYYDGTEKIVPAKNSLRVSGKIILISNEDVYSSAGSCLKLSLVDPADRFVSIGRPVGMYLGGGFDPLNFQLKHSELVYKIEPAIDVTGAKNATDVMQDRTEIRIPETLGELRTKFTYSGNVWSHDYLAKYDPFVKTALALP